MLLISRYIIEGYNIVNNFKSMIKLLQIMLFTTDLLTIDTTFTSNSTALKNLQYIEQRYDTQTQCFCCIT